jgi:hypothetical protein
MKKTLCFVSIIFAFACFSCTKTVEDKIRNEFKNYVHQNLDDPESLKEILGITLDDTVSAKGTAEQLREIIAQFDSVTVNLQCLSDSLRKVVLETCKRPRALSEFRRDRHLQGLMLKFADLVNEEIDYISSAEQIELKSDRKDLDESLSKLESDSTIFFTYKIRTRIENHGELSIKEYYARIYINDSIVILDNNGISSYPPHLSDAFKSVDTYAEGVKKEWSLHKRCIDNSKEILRDVYLKVGIQ